MSSKLFKILLTTVFFCMSETAHAQWAVSISLSSGDYVDPYTTIGVDLEATNGYDSDFDIFNMSPPWSPYLDGYIYHNDWGQFNGPYARDIRDGNDLNQEWHVSINEEGITDSITVEISLEDPCCWEIIVDTQGQTDTLLNYLSYTIPPSDSDLILSATSLCTQGDLNQDGESDILDIVGLVAIIMDINTEPGFCQLCAVDFNGDEILDILDIVALVSSILNS